MALSVIQIINPRTTAGGYKLPGSRYFMVSGKGGAREHCTVFAGTKLNGDTTGVVDTKLRVLRQVIILLADGTTVDTTGTATAGSRGSGATVTGTVSTTLASLTAGTSFFLICKGLPPGR
jgi:hypothetical protein